MEYTETKSIGLIRNLSANKITRIVVSEILACEMALIKFPFAQ